MNKPPITTPPFRELHPVSQALVIVGATGLAFAFGAVTALTIRALITVYLWAWRSL